MSTQIPNSFVQQWSSEVKSDYQQMGSKLRQAVRSVSGVTGSVHNWHRLGTVAANTKTRDADVTGLNPAQTTVATTLVDNYAPIYIDKLDELKTNADFRREYVKTSSAALGRATDGHIVTAMDATNTPIATVAGGLTYSKLLEITESLNGTDAPMSERFLIIGPKQMSDALAITNLTSVDYMNMKAIVQGEVNTALGFNWIMSNQLNIVTTERQCYGVHSASLGLAIGQDITTEINWIPEKVSFLVNSYMSMGASTIDAQGVILMQCTE